MRKFSEVHTENTLPAPHVPTLAEMHNSAMIAENSHRGDRNIHWMKIALELAQKAVQEGEIVSTDLETVKKGFGQFIEAVFEFTAGPGKFGPHDREYNAAVDDCYYGKPETARELPAYIKKLNKVPTDKQDLPFYKPSMKCATEMMPLSKLWDWLKAHTIMASAKKKREREQAVVTKQEVFKAHSSAKDMGRVIALLQGEATHIHAVLFKNKKADLHSTLEMYKKSIAKHGHTDYLELFDNTPYKFEIQNFVELVSSDRVDGKWVRVFKIRDDIDSYIETSAARSADDVVDHFVHKNSAKLAHIITTKNNMKDVTLTNVKIGTGMVECDLNLTFEDGSSFKANSSVVWARSVLGNMFYRYPTIFQNVVLPDGSKMGQPSEERMDKIFAQAK